MFTSMVRKRREMFAWTVAKVPQMLAEKVTILLQLNLPDRLKCGFVGQESAEKRPWVAGNYPK
jgi:hypothetical protein